MADRQFGSAHQDSAYQAVSAPSAGQLLFINKDANNLSRTSAEIYAVGSHVSRGSQKWKQRNSSLKTDPSTGRILAAAGLDASNTTRSRSNPVKGKAMTFRWRLQDGNTGGASTVYGQDESRKRRSKVVKSATTSPTRSMSTTPTMPLSSTSTPPPQSGDHGLIVKSHIKFYLDVVRPFALAISRSWLWVDDVSLIMSSPALTYSICAFVSAFRQSLQKGLYSLALPPDAANDGSMLWPVPEWFVFQAQAISLLRQHLATTSVSERPVQKAELHAMLFLMRLQVSLGDREAALMHLNAIKSATEHAAILPDLNIDIAMWKVSLMVAYKYKPYVMLRSYIRAKDPALQEPVLDIDLAKVLDPQEHWWLKAHVSNRTTMWCGNSLPYTSTMVAQETLVDDFLLIDPDFRTLNSTVQQTILQCLVLSRCLLSSLRYLNADTTNHNIRDGVADLRRLFIDLMQNQDYLHLWKRAPRLIFYVAFTGVFASRGNEEGRLWFVQQLCKGVNFDRETAQDDILKILGMFFDPATVHQSLLQEIWNDIWQYQNSP